MFTKNTKKEEVYSSTNMGDLLSSPVFYSVIALAFILGLSSIFGFFNDPRKLKNVVDVISQKIIINSNSNTVSFEAEEDYLRRNYSLKAISSDKPFNVSHSLSSTSTYSYSADDLYNLSSKLVVLDVLNNFSANEYSAQKVSFDYDITSKQFWGALDANRIESAIEESQTKNMDSVMIGAPLSSDYFLEKGDDKYSMTAGILRL